MAYKTMRQIMVDVQKALYQASGTGVQQYSQDVILQQIQNGFDHVFGQEWWPHFRVREFLTLNGTNGLTTTPLVHITALDDIRYIYAEGDHRPLPMLPMGVNPTGAYLSGGTRPIFYEGHPTNIFRVYPNTAQGNIQVVGRARPAPYTLDDVVKMDPTLLLHFAAWSYFTDDASNPEAAMKHKQLFELRYQQIRNDTFSGPVLLDPLMDRIPDQWTESRRF